MNRKARKNLTRKKLEENWEKPKTSWDTLRQVLPSKNNRTEIDKIAVDGKELKSLGLLQLTSVTV